ncbi:MAG TPA: hypothetical protein DDY57_06305 [Franconibacter pulveris]|nr:hypothetical protein [Franconibacter pulveris]
MAKLNIFFSEKTTLAQEDGLYLVPDNAISGYARPWNDFGHEVLFGLYYKKQAYQERVGMTKILHRDNPVTAEYFRSGRAQADSVWNITSLMSSDNVVSLGTKIDFYKNINYLRTHYAISAIQVLQSLCDASFLKERGIQGWQQWNGYELALMRNTTTAEALLEKGMDIAQGIDSGPADITLSGMHLPASFDCIEFVFARYFSINRSNINVLIGKNGLGKTRILQEVIDSATGLKPTPEVKGKFLKVVVAAYSPFEEFYTQQQYIDLKDNAAGDVQDSNEDKLKRQKEMLDSYTYIGFKNPQGQFDKTWPMQQAAAALKTILDYDAVNECWNRPSRFKLLTDTLGLALKFDDIAFISNEESLISVHQQNIDYSKIDLTAGLVFLRNGEAIKLSAGQRIYTYLIPPLIAEIVDETLVVLDEPELYLHPELEVGLINMLKSLLNETRSYALIATHSALMVRETHRDRVTILQPGQKEDEDTAATHAVKPQSETFAASLENIIGEAFNDYYQKKPFEDEIDKKVAAYGSLDEAIAELYQEVGSSGQLYLLSKRSDTPWELENNDEESH